MDLTIEKANELMERNGGSLDLSRTSITTLPDNLTVGGWLDLSYTPIDPKEREKVKRLRNGDIVFGRYIYADDQLFHYSGKAKKLNEYTIYVGKIKGKYLVTDGEHWAHCKSPREGIADILFKKAADRGADQYKGIDVDKEYTVEELKTMYRIITGACRAGTESFVNSIKDLKESYTIREAIALTEGQYNSAAFERFFE